MATSEQLSLGLATGPARDAIESGDVPEGWRLASLGTVCAINPSRKGRTNYDDMMPVTFVPMAAVDEVRGIIAAPETRPFSAVKKGYTWFIENDVLFAKITPCMQNGKAAIARNLANGVGFGSTEFHVLRPGPDVLPEWVHLFVRQPSFRAAAAQHFTGSVGQQRVPESFLATQLIPVPPLAEQRRIVARIEELAARIERARGLRQEAMHEIESSPIVGARLVLGDIDVEPTGLRHWIDANRDGIQTGPFGAQLGTHDFVDAGVPVLTIGNVQYNGLDLTDLKRVTLEKAADLRRFEIRAGDILFARMGTIGRCCVVPEDAEGWLINYHIIKVALDTTRVEPRFIHWTIRASPDVQRYLEAKTIGATRAGVNSNIVGGLPCRVPELAEQRRIAAYLDGLQSKADTLKSLQMESAVELDALLPAVLERAFKGAI